MLGAILGVSGASGVYWGGKWTRSLTTLSPSPGSQQSHWFPLGSDLPGKGQASDRNELCRLLCRFGTIFCDSFCICHLITYSYTQYSEMIYGLFSLQNNLCISLHNQCDILQHTGSNYEQLLFSSDI